MENQLINNGDLANQPIIRMPVPVGPTQDSKPVRDPVIVRNPVPIDSENSKEVKAVEEGEEWREVGADMLDLSCAFFAQDILTGPPEPPYNGNFIIAEHHEIWDDLINDYKRICVLAPRDHGKCGRGDELLLSGNGERVRLDEWQGGEMLVWNKANCQYELRKVPASRRNGVKPLVKIVTRTGRVLVVTKNHPLLTFINWQQAAGLKVGDRIAVARSLPELGKNSLEDAWLLGLLVGGGSLTGSAVCVTMSDAGIKSAVDSVAAENGWEVKPTNDKITYRLSTKQGRRIGTVKDWSRKHRIMGKTAHRKCVPESVYKADNKSVGEFISGYFDADGTVNEYGGGSLEFYSVRYDLLEGVQHLLTRLGVISVVSSKRGMCDGEVHLSWRLTVRGQDILTLAKWLQLRSDKQEALNALIVQQEQKGFTSGKCVDCFPEDVWGLLNKSEDWHRKQGGSRPAMGGEPTRSKVARVAQQENNSELMRYVDAPIFWDEIVSVSLERPAMTWALAVPGMQTYLANEIINHNTFFFDFAYPLWKVREPGSIGFIFSANQDQAIRILSDIKAEIETNPKLQHLVPRRKDRSAWSAAHIRCSNGSHIYARGMGTKVRGAHPNWIVVDDGLNDESAYSETVRKKQKEYFYTAITNMIVPGGQIIVVGTPFHMDDLYADLKNNLKYKYHKDQAIKDDGTCLWAERYSLESLEERKKEIGTVRFTREFMCDPMGDDMSLFPRYLFRGDPVECYNLTLGMSKEFWDSVGVQIFSGWDFAMSTSAKADYAVGFTIGVDKFGNRWIIDIIRKHGLGFQEQLSLINEQGRKYDPALIFLESNQMQRIFGDELIRTSDLPIKQFVTGLQKNTLDKGVPSLRVLLENGKFRIPRGDARSVEMTNIWIDEMHAFTWVDGKLQGVGSHDDTVMSCFASGAMVTTIEGKKPIECVSVGDYVLTHKGRWRKVLETMQRDYSGRAYKGKGSGLGSFIVTDEHPIYRALPKRDSVKNNQRLIVDGDSWDFVKSSEIRCGHKQNGDWLLQPIPKWDNWCGGLDISKFVLFQKHPHGGNCWKKDSDTIWWRKDRKVPRYLNIDEEFGFLIGLFLAEGSVGGHQVSFGLHKRETYLSDFIQRVMNDRFSALGDINVIENSMQCYVSTVPGANLFKLLGKSTEKGMPWRWMGLPLNVRLQIVRGWLAGDGNLLSTNLRTMGGNGIRGVTIASKIRDQVAWTLKEAGYHPAICDFNNPGVNAKPAWQISLSALDTARLLQNMRSEEIERWYNIKLSNRKNPTNNRAFNVPGGLATRISLWDEINYVGQVYNIQVEEDESYVVEGIAVHNCWICDQAIRDGGFTFTFGEEFTNPGVGMDDRIVELTGKSAKKEQRYGYQVPKTREERIEEEVEARKKAAEAVKGGNGGYARIPNMTQEELLQELTRRQLTVQMKSGSVDLSNWSG